MLRVEILPTLTQSQIGLWPSCWRWTRYPVDTPPREPGEQRGQPRGLRQRQQHQRHQRHERQQPSSWPRELITTMASRSLAWVKEYCGLEQLVSLSRRRLCRPTHRAHQEARYKTFEAGSRSSSNVSEKRTPGTKLKAALRVSPRTSSATTSRPPEAIYYEQLHQPSGTTAALPRGLLLPSHLAPASRTAANPVGRQQRATTSERLTANTAS